MSKLKDDRKLIYVNIPGTHDSAACYMNRMSFNWARTQNLRIADLLRIGVRRLDIRIVQRNNDISEDEDIITCHGICDCYTTPNCCDFTKVTYKSIILDVKNFLEENPTEAVLFGTYLGRGKNYNALTRAYQIYEKYVGNMSIYFNHDLTMKDVRGKFVSYTKLVDEFDRDNNFIRKRVETILPSTGISDVHRKYQDCATFKTNGNIKIREMRDMFDIYKMTFEEAEIKDKNKEMQFPIAYSISCTGEYDYCLPNPLDQAIIVHSFIQREDCYKKGYYYGWIYMDFANKNTNIKLINSNFTEGEDISLNDFPDLSENIFLKK